MNTTEHTHVYVHVFQLYLCVFVCIQEVHLMYDDKVHDNIMVILYISLVIVLNTIDYIIVL